MIVPAKEQTTATVAQHYDDLDRFYRELCGDRGLSRVLQARARSQQ